MAVINYELVNKRVGQNQLNFSKEKKMQASEHCRVARHLHLTTEESFTQCLH